MPGTSKSNRHDDRSEHTRIRKSILRNPEVARSTKSVESCYENKEFVRRPEDCRGFHEEQSTAQSKFYHEPRLNKVVELRKSLNEIKTYDIKSLDSLQDLTLNSKNIVNREVSGDI